MSRQSAGPPNQPPPNGRRVPCLARGLRLGLVLIVLAVLGCDRGDTTGAEATLTADEFVEVMVELREAERAVMEEDSAQELFVRRKAEILERHGTSEEEIRAYVAAASRDLPELEAVWEEISSRLRSAGEPDPVPIK